MASITTLNSPYFFPIVYSLWGEDPRCKNKVVRAQRILDGSRSTVGILEPISILLLSTVS